MKTLRVKTTMIDELLGTASGNDEIHAEFIASKAPNAPSFAEEVEALGVAAEIEKSMTVFPRNADGKPIMWDYQIRGFFKEACGFLRKVAGTKSSKVQAYKKMVDGLVFVVPRMIPICFEGQVGTCQRPLRGQTAQGERIALANSETIPAGAEMEFEVKCLCDDDIALVLEWLEYGELHGLGQWRNSGKGRFKFEVME